MEYPPTRIGQYDIDLIDFIIELDEENHFNRYRKITLESEFYTECNHFDIEQYKQFCADYESDCLTYGKYWNSISADKQFGRNPSNDDFKVDRKDTPPSRFKQRAFYDFIKDIHSQINNITLLRISIYDTYKASKIKDLIDMQERDILLNYIKNK